MSRHGRGRDRGLGAILAGLGLGAISIGGAAAAVGASWKVAEALVKAKKLYHVRGENAVFVRLTDRVKVDLRELERLLALKEVKEALRHNKGKTYWLKEKVEDVKEAIDGMQKYTRKVANAGWWLGLRTRLWWVLDEYEKLIHREMELASAREGVLAAIEFLSQFEENPEHHHHKGGESRHTTVKKEVDIDVDVDENKRGRRVIELDVEGRPIRRPEPRYEEFVEEDIRYDEEERPFRVSARDGFYDGRLDGPLSTRPSWWAEKYGVQGSDEYIKRTVVEEKIETDVPLRVHWPTKL